MQNLTRKIILQTEKWGAHNYSPLPVVLSRARGVWVWDVEGKRYLDMLSCYSAVSQGHLHPKIVQTAQAQMKKLTLTSRAFYNDQLAKFFEKLCRLTGMEKALPMNSGAEAVETALKLARKWGYLKKKVAKDRAEVIVCKDNFHGRTTTIISFSTNPQYRYGFGPYMPGFKIIPYNDIKALKKAINRNTVGFLVEPIQGEGGINVPDPGYLRDSYKICKEDKILFLDDEIQTGLGRTGRLLCIDYENIKPDILILGKALGGGLYPVSVILAKNNIMNVFKPGDHGSTFGGNPLAAAIALSALDVITKERLSENAARVGSYFINRLKEINSPVIREVRGKGLLIGIEINKKYGRARDYCEKLLHLRILTKETHESVIRFAPPLIIKRAEIDWAMERIRKVFA
ncbi:MAG: ornithine--oxo-acid transaminase [candidate division WOR-3 bacterium]